MTVTLRPMSDDEASTFLTESTDRYVADLVWTGMKEADARRSAEELIDLMFPDRHATDRHLLFHVDEGGVAKGALWIGWSRTDTPDRWAVWEIFVHEEHRGRGVGTAAMLLAEDEVRARGGTEMMLSVFGYNDGARRVYERIGYEPTATQMRKVL